MKRISFIKTISILSLVVLSACVGLSSNMAAPTPAQPGGVAQSASTATSSIAIAPVTPTMPVTTVSGPASVTVTSTTVAAVTTPSPIAATRADPASTTCTSPAALTIAQTEGPYFKAGSPERSILASGLPGNPLVLTGYVLTADCKPVAHAMLDFWQANASGQYDNAGYTLRGHQFTDANGRFQVDTIVPGLYPGRTEHIHVKVQAPGGPILTTQLYFPGVTQNDEDGIFDPSLVMKIQTTNGGMAGSFNFVIATK